MSQLALNHLCKQWRKACISLENARNRSGITDEEIMHLQTTVAILEWVIRLIKTEIEKENER